MNYSAIYVLVMREFAFIYGKNWMSMHQTGCKQSYQQKYCWNASACSNITRDLTADLGKQTSTATADVH